MEHNTYMIGSAVYWKEDREDTGVCAHISLVCVQVNVQTVDTGQCTTQLYMKSMFPVLFNIHTNCRVA